MILLSHCAGSHKYIGYIHYFDDWSAYLIAFICVEVSWSMMTEAGKTISCTIYKSWILMTIIVRLYTKKCACKHFVAKDFKSKCQEIVNVCVKPVDEIISEGCQL